MKTNKLTVGILAHVDAGKTTLSESILFETGRINKLGRVDHKDAYLDTYELEKSRGITIFSKQAVLQLDPYTITLLDTPGHVDFSAEMERTLRVLDYAVLVINGTDGVQGHTLTVWKLLKRYNIPTVIFVNKMDLISADHDAILAELQNRVDENCIEFGHGNQERFMDELALCDEIMMEAYLEDGSIEVGPIKEAIARRHVFPIYFGSALKNKGVKAFLEGLQTYLKAKTYPDIFGARVFKVIRNEQGERLTYIKLTGGTLKVKTSLTNKHQRNLELNEDETLTIWQEKVDQIRIYSGASYESVKDVGPGTICTLTGLSMTKPGDGLGFEHKGEAPALVPVLSYRIEFPDGINVYSMLKNLRMLEEEEPHLNVVWNDRLAEIHVQVMGEIQIEILKSTIQDRFGVSVSFDKGNLVYRETIKSAVIGVGHFEPLKHYAEVHLMLEPLEAGQGMVYVADCSEDVLDRNWQRLVLSHLHEKQHNGVLTGSVITDMRVTLVTGRGHNKHTEGGDFREATFRALRQGLMKAKSLLLEPMYDYTLELPKDMLGKALSDIDRMKGRCDEPMIEGEHAVLKGSAPVATMMHYATDVAAYSKGQGRLGLSLKGYEPAHNQAVVVEAIGYDPEQDVDNPAGSVFCSKGTGYGVAWQEADRHMHMDSGIRLNENKQAKAREAGNQPKTQRSAHYSDQELEAIFVKTYGEQKQRPISNGSRMMDASPSSGKKTSYKPTQSGQNRQKTKKKEVKEQYLLVDGYNIVFAWDELKTMAENNLDGARMRLMDILSNYQGQTEETIILVFDAYRVAGNRGEVFPYHNIFVVYTKEAETADQYIERLVHSIRPHYEVTVATSDVVEQVIILGKGARRLSAEGFKKEVENVEDIIRDNYPKKTEGEKHRPFEKFLKQPKNDH